MFHSRFNPMDLPLFTQSSSLEFDSSADSSVVCGEGKGKRREEVIGFTHFFFFFWIES